ncbi:MAG: hypothetical protein V1851_01140 [Patescibacteria group bacterium]
MKSIKYEVVFKPFAEKHFIKSFAKKYKNTWDFTFEIIIEEFKRIDVLFFKTIAEIISDPNKSIIICKTEFKIAGTKDSRHRSGNRCIVALHKEINEVRVLLVYHKKDLKGNNETVAWKKIIKENYPEYNDLI